MFAIAIVSVVNLEGPVSQVDTVEVRGSRYTHMVRVRLENQGDERWIRLGPPEWLEERGFSVQKGDTLRIRAMEGRRSGDLVALKVQKRERNQWRECVIRNEQGRPEWAGSGQGQGSGQGRGYGQNQGRGRGKGRGRR